MSFPQQEYYRLETLEKRWDVEKLDITYVIEMGLLRACIWLPVCFIEKGYRKGDELIVATPEKTEGLVALRVRDCRRVLTHGEAKVCCFLSINEENIHLRLSPEEPEQEPVLVSIHHLVVSNEDCSVFETEHNLLSSSSKKTKIRLLPPERNKDTFDACFSHSNNYHIVVLDGEEYTLGGIQAGILKNLHNAANTSDNPWVHGKSLLYDAGSSGQRLRDVFKSQKEWRKLIISDRRGYYRLNLH